MFEKRDSCYNLNYLTCGFKPTRVSFRRVISKIRLIETKCPKSKKNSKISDLVNDQSFYDK